MSPEISPGNTEDVQILHISAGQPPYQIHALAVGIGREWVVTAGNGDSPCASVAVARHNQDCGQISPPERYLTIEAQYAHEAARSLSDKLAATVVFSLGLELEDATPDDSEKMFASLRSLLRALGEQLPAAD